MTNFTDQLLKFVQSADAIDDEVFSNCLELISEYLVLAGSTYYEATVDGVRLDGAPYLQRVWGSSSSWDTSNGNSNYTIYESSDRRSFHGLRAHVYHEGKPIWIVADDPAVPIAKQQSAYRDHWRNQMIETQYIDLVRSNACTSIYLPLAVADDRVFGVLVMEFDSCILPSAARVSEVRELSEALATLLWLHHTSAQHLKNTRNAYARLLNNVSFDRSTLQTVSAFFASPLRVDEAVLETVTRTFAERGVKLVCWRDLHEAGTILEQIEERIAGCNFGICYLSEKADEQAESGELPFFDNANVLFEAGMMQAGKRLKPVGRAAGGKGKPLWIAIRENANLSGPPPFDLASLRMIVVPRTGDGDLEVDDFQNEVREKMNDVLSQIEMHDPVN